MLHLPAAEVTFQKEAGATAAELSRGDDRDSVSEDVSLVHKVSRQDYGTACRQRSKANSITIVHFI